MYATQSSRLGVPRQATVTPLRRRRRRPSTFASGFLLPSIAFVPPEERTGRSDRGAALRWTGDIAANLTSALISVSRSRLPAKNACAPAAHEARPRGIRESLGVRSPWTNGPSYFDDALARARQTVRFGRLWIAVHKWITCEHFSCRSSAVSARRERARGSG